MIFDQTIGYAEIISFISLIFVIIGAIVTFVQWQKAIKRQRADYINELTEKIRTDIDIREIVYIIDYNVKWYNEKFQDSGDFERKVDKTLSYFSYICYLKHEKAISKKEFIFFKYEIERIVMNTQVINYFYNLYHFAQKFNCPITFKYLFDYGEKHKYFNKDFFSPNSSNYPHYLNF